MKECNNSMLLYYK